VCQLIKSLIDHIMLSGKIKVKVFMVSVPINQKFNKSHNAIMEANESHNMQNASFFQTACDNFKLIVIRD
jgi:hypothetical protein